MDSHLSRRGLVTSLEYLKCARLTRESFASEDFGSDSYQKAYNALLELLPVKQEMEQDEIDYNRFRIECSQEGHFTDLHMALDETPVLRNAVVCRIACLVSDLPDATMQWQEKEKLRLAATANRKQVESASIISQLQHQQVEEAGRAVLCHAFQCRLYRGICQR